VPAAWAASDTARIGRPVRTAAPIRTPRRVVGWDEDDILNNSLKRNG
jgi:hypothetical protein